MPTSIRRTVEIQFLADILLLGSVGLRLPVHLFLVGFLFGRGVSVALLVGTAFAKVSSNLIHLLQH